MISIEKFVVCLDLWNKISFNIRKRSDMIFEVLVS